MKHRASRGALIIEAGLAAVVIGVGLVYVSRSFSTHLKALQTVEQRHAMLLVARSTLREMEGRRSSGLPPFHGKEGTFPPPDDHLRWVITVQPNLEVSPAQATVHLSVEREDRASSRVELVAVWPAAWVPDEWL